MVRVLNDGDMRAYGVLHEKDGRIVIESFGEVLCIMTNEKSYEHLGVFHNGL